MLQYPYKKFKWSGKAQSGFYVDYIYKNFAEIFIRNVFIYAALFFGEKYMIEVFTKKFIDNFIFISNKYVGFTTLWYQTFFNLFMSFILYTLLIFNLIILFIY
jgi:hypothetical protein